jgi:glycine cleavage system aminomethyltransferase T
VSTHALREDLPSPLRELERRAGAVFATHAGLPIAVNYGSAAGELAACVSAAGLSDCSEMTKLELAASAEQIGRVILRLTGSEVAPGGAVFAGGAWWCAAEGGRAIVLCEPGAGQRLLNQLHAHTAQQPDLGVRDRSADWAMIAVIGRRTIDVLRALGVFGESGDPRGAAPFSAHPIADVPAFWLLESDHRAVALVPRDQGGTAWRAIERAGTPVGLCCVGSEAVSRYALLERQRAPMPQG